MDFLFGMIVGGHYKLVEKIGSGHFGVIYRAIHIHKKHEVAIKLELIRHGRNFSMLSNEYNLYNKFNQIEEFVPKVFWFGSEKGYNILIMELLGRSLEDMFISSSKNFSLDTVVSLAIKMITLTQRLHAKNFLHRDVTPGNFLTGLNCNMNELFLIDFGYSKMFWDSRLGKHRPNRRCKNMIGTPEYASFNAQKKQDLSRRDDLESIGYILVYFMLGKLPWQDVKVDKPWQRREAVSKIMTSTSITNLCKGLPKQFHLYLNYCRGLKFEEKPNYSYLRSLFQDLQRNSNNNCDKILCWQIQSVVTDEDTKDREYEATARRLDEQSEHLQCDKILVAINDLNLEEEK